MFFITFENKVCSGGSYGIKSCKAFCNEHGNIFKAVSAYDYGKVITGTAHEPYGLDFVKIHDFSGDFIVTVIAFGLYFKLNNRSAVIGIDSFPIYKGIISDDNIVFFILLFECVDDTFEVLNFEGCAADETAVYVGVSKKFFCV